MSVGLSVIEFYFEILGMFAAGFVDNFIAALFDNFITPLLEALSGMSGEV